LLAGLLCFFVQISERLFLSPRTVGSHLLEQAGGRSAPGEATVSAFASFRVTPCSRKAAFGGSRPGAGGQHMLVGDRLAPVL
jgi:hypothetical protein